MKAVLLHPTAIPIVAEIAADPHARFIGLRGRYHIPWNSGMLFVFQKPEFHNFTMVDTPRSLDLIFLDREGMVVGILLHTEPFSRGPYAIGLPSKYVLETNAGWARFYGVEPGDVFTYTAL